MSYYSQELVEEIRSRSDIVDVISGYIRLQRKGSNYVGVCPFHNDRNPSMSVNQPRQIYHCFSCGAGGDVFKFVMDYEGLTFPEAMRTLADRAGVELPRQEYSEEAKQQADLKTQILELNRLAAKYYYYMLRQPAGKQGWDYLTGRSLSADTIKRFGLGYASKYSDDLYRYLKNKGYSDQLLKESGLMRADEKRGMYDKFWNRVIFPIMDANNRVIGFGGRVMGDGKPKYLNSPETRVFDKSRNLYGLNFARRSRKPNIILCEGYMDVIAMHQAGFTQAVASLGTAFTQQQSVILKRYTNEVLLTYDSDEAGVRAAMRAIPILKDAGLTARILRMEPYKDPDEFIKKNGREAFQERIDQAENSFFFEIRMLERDYDLKDPESKTLFYKEIAKKLCGFSVDVERENYLEAIAEKYHIGFENLRRLVGSYAMQTGVDKPPERPRSGVQPKNTPQENSKRSQRLLLTWIVDDPALYPRIARYVGPEDFTEDLYRQVAEQLFRDMEAGQYQPASIISRFQDEEQQRRVAELFNTELPQLSTRQEREKALHDIVYAVKKNSYEQLTMQLGSDVTALSRAVSGKKALEELAKTHISLE